MSSENLSLEFFNRKFQQVLDDNAITRNELRVNTESMASLTRSLRRIELSLTAMETRFAALREEIYDLVKMELGGSLAHQATKQEIFVKQRIDNLHQEFLDIIGEIFESVDTDDLGEEVAVVGQGATGTVVVARLKESAAKVVQKHRLLNPKDDE